jgi:hypothetical protein
MAKRKDSKTKTTSQKKVLGKSPIKSPAKKNSQTTAKKKSVKKVDDAEVKKGKRKAVRKKGFAPSSTKGTSEQVPTKVRKISDWNIVSSSISKWCKENGSRCTKKQISEIYQGLKERRLKGDPKYKLTAEDIQLGIQGELILNKGTSKEEKVDLLAYKNDTSVPAQFFTFPWFNAPSFFNNDGLFFRDEDVFFFDLTPIGRGLVQTTYKDFNTKYRDELYMWITQDIDDYEDRNGIPPSPPPDFILNQEETDLNNRVFEWKFQYQSSILPNAPTQEGQQRVTGVLDTSLPTEAQVKAQNEEDTARQNQVSEQDAKERLKIDKMNAKTRQLEAKNEARKIDLEEVKMGIMSVEDYNKKWKK